ncbi:MAG: glycoside hydrolase family 30 protein [Solirubrobacteraceae bacterium]
MVQTSASLSEHLTSLPDLEFGSGPAGNEPVINVNAGVRYQRVRGFGAAMTDSSAWLIERELSPAARQALMSELFGVTGIRLDFVKVAMGASDFTHDGRPYTYDDMAPGRSDPRLADFSIAHDRAYILPALRQALALDPATEFLATPWTPPAWMKANDSLSNAGNRGTLLPGDYGAWAAYVVKFIEAYARAGISIGSVTIQNEPSIPTLYPGLNFPVADEATWIVEDLDPALAAAGLHPRIYGNELGWGRATTYASASVRGPAGGDLTGLAWHCYFGSPGVMGAFEDADPRLDQIVDECSPGISSTPMSEVVIASLRNWASTVALWNLALDPSGGPAQPPNHGCEGCQGLATIDPQTGAVWLNQSYYALGQASTFVAPGAQRIATGHFVTYSYPRRGANVATPGLDDVALRNPDGSLVLMAYDNATVPITFAVTWQGRAFTDTLAAGATVTFVWNRA